MQLVNEQEEISQTPDLHITIHQIVITVKIIYIDPFII